jgi:hypothetical protein
MLLTPRGRERAAESCLRKDGGAGWWKGKQVAYDAVTAPPQTAKFAYAEQMEMKKMERDEDDSGEHRKWRLHSAAKKERVWTLLPNKS